MDVRAQRRCAPTDLLLRQSIPDRHLGTFFLLWQWEKQQGNDDLQSGCCLLAQQGGQVLNPPLYVLPNRRRRVTRARLLGPLRMPSESMIKNLDG